MAEATLEADSVRTIPATSVRDLSLEIQSDCRSALALASAIDRELDGPNDLDSEAEGRILCFLNLLQAAVQTAADKAERIEIASLPSQREAAK